MSMLLRPTRWFRGARAPRADVQSGTNEPVSRNMTVDYAKADDDFTSVDVRPMTYAEAVAPGARARVLASAPYSVYDESKLAVQMVEQYEQHEAARNARAPRASPHVIANVEYGGDSMVREKPRARKRRNSRRSE